MRSLCLSIIVALTYAVVRSPAMPVITDMAMSLTPRTQYCQNSPTTVAGTTFNGRSLSPSNDLATRHAMKNNITWCAPNSRTYIVMTVLHAIPGQGVLEMLEGALQLIIDTMSIFGDGIIEAQAGGHVFRWLQGGIAVTVVNANNHQTTWGVLRAAIASVGDCMISNAVEGAVSFRIVDGGNVVGEGTIA